ncbi:MAG: hypothetical protein JXR32_07780 [Anaerolineaceae bacterium]|nr:hypothetical protein [Anaerolineaceae bacterium]
MDVYRCACFDLVRDLDHRDGSGYQSIASYNKSVRYIFYPIIESAPPAPRKGIIELGGYGCWGIAPINPLVAS